MSKLITLELSPGETLQSLVAQVLRAYGRLPGAQEADVIMCGEVLGSFNEPVSELIYSYVDELPTARGARSRDIDHTLRWLRSLDTPRALLDPAKPPNLDVAPTVH